MRHQLLVFFCLLFCGCLFAQQSNVFVYKQNTRQSFRLRSGTSKVFHLIQLEQKAIVTNSLFDFHKEIKQLEIPISGYYELSGRFHFNLNAENVYYSRAGINFGIIKIQHRQEQFIAATRVSFNKENQEEYQFIEILPTIVFLEKGTLVAPAISVGLLDKNVFDANIGCDKKLDPDCISFEWNLKKLKDETTFPIAY